MLSLDFLVDGGLPRISAGSASALPFSRPAQRSLHVTACTFAKLPIATLYTEGFNSFVTSTVAPIATGWSDSCRVGFAPTENRRLSTAHSQIRAKG